MRFGFRRMGWDSRHGFDRRRFWCGNGPPAGDENRCCRRFGWKRSVLIGWCKGRVVSCVSLSWALCHGLCQGEFAACRCRPLPEMVRARPFAGIFLGRKGRAKHASLQRHFEMRDSACHKFCRRQTDIRNPDANGIPLASGFSLYRSSYVSHPLWLCGSPRPASPVWADKKPIPQPDYR